VEETTVNAQRNSFWRRIVEIGCAALLLMSAPAASVAASEQRPMDGHYTIAVVPVEQRCGPNALTIGFEGMGIATHFGRMEGIGSNCTSFNLATEAVPIWNGHATFVAADGSSMTLTYEGSQDAPVDGKATASSTFTVISGTGRFEGATGSWPSSGVIDFTAGVFHGSFSGWISY
jgi:hypothetical protein